MPALPEGTVEVPADGTFPEFVAEHISATLNGDDPRTFSLYVHIPFCQTRCGYCDFNTYTSKDLGPGASRESFAETAIKEIDFAVRAMEKSNIPSRKIHSVFFGGGTPTLLPAADLNRVLEHAIKTWGIENGAEVTTEANPDSLTADYVDQLKAGGFTRISVGMQSSVTGVLAVLERTHDPANVAKAVAWAKEAGLKVSLDLIFGTPGETLEDWESSINTAVALKPDHISAYGLIVEEGTKLAAQIRRGVYPPTNPDDQADKYLIAEKLFAASGYRWYEISNWAYDPENKGINRAKHNIAYWRDMDWWGIGPGSHSHMAGVRWWNAKHPAAYAQRLFQEESPAVGREIPDADARALEKIMLGVRLSEGLGVAELFEVSERAEDALHQDLHDLQTQGLIEPEALADSRIVPTLQGRLLDDAIVRRLAGF